MYPMGQASEPLKISVKSMMDDIQQLLRGQYLHHTSDWLKVFSMQTTSVNVTVKNFFDCIT